MRENNNFSRGFNTLLKQKQGDPGIWIHPAQYKEKRIA